MVIIYERIATLQWQRVQNMRFMIGTSRPMFLRCIPVTTSVIIRAIPEQTISNGRSFPHSDLRPLAPLRVYSLPSPPVPGSPSPDSNLPNKPASTAAEDREPPQSAHGQKKKPHPNEPVALGILRALDTEDRERYTHIQKKTSHRMRQHDFSERCIPPCRVRQLVIGVHRRSWKKVHNLQRPIKGNLTKVQLIRGEGEVFGILVKTSTMKARKKRIKRMTPSGE